MIWQKVKFKFSRKSPIEVSQEIDGYLAEIGLDSNFIIINNVGNIEVTSLEEASIIAKEIADKLLRKLSWKYNFVTEIKPDPDETEYIDPNSGRSLKLKYTYAVVNILPRVSFQDEKDGKIISDSERPGKITGKSFEAESYFYRGALSKNSYDKFRNFYLVAEFISSHICQQKNIRWKYEQELFELGLRECFQNKLPDLVDQANKVSIVATQSEVIPKVATFLYKGNRCCLNHAKEGGNKKVPFNPEDEESVKKALPLIEYVAKAFLENAKKAEI